MTTITINTWCRMCGLEFVADRAAIVAGVWRLCERCRPPQPATPPPPVAGNGGVRA